MKNYSLKKLKQKILTYQVVRDIDVNGVIRKRYQRLLNNTFLFCDSNENSSFKFELLFLNLSPDKDFYFSEFDLNKAAKIVRWNGKIFKY
ncbi:hypothetical protein BpHYR1_018492 [Brachionus plicatilis]|uniref:Uncharacterized protein n=1 Tax=Brachionus plicatilis TaxID=10195 RepID=A0A3M7ST93_BRAPC|nr:hypothetical protein BpHYR1_018492 [Brachionus plicatilis]